MKTISKIILALLFTCNLAIAQDTLYIYQNGSVAIKSAINKIDSISFYKTGTSTSGNMVTDIDGNIYHTVTIGTQVWMVENLKVTHYRNGDAIPNVTDNASWSGLTSGAYCWYNNDEASYKTTYGAIYNWYAVNDSRSICPVGWHVPSDFEWTVLTTYLGGESVAGGKLQESGTTHWNSPNEGATNETGFSALPGGWRNLVGSFYFIGSQGNWGSSTENQVQNQKFYSRSIDQYTGVSVLRNNLDKKSGVSIRCIKD